MASPKSENQSKTPELKKAPGKKELSQEELDKVAGGLRNNTGGRGRIADPCDGGE
jgi:hypothetical protein